MSKVLDSPGYRDGWCVHYRYQRDVPTEVATCEAGVRYVDLNDGQTFGVFKDAPCFLDKGKPKPGARHCDKLRLPTPEEIAAHKAWSEIRMNRLMTVMHGIAAWRKAHKGKSASEVVECPACKGRLHLSIAAYNGHVHGNCETPDCVSWME